MSEIANNNSDFLMSTRGSQRGEKLPGARSSADAAVDGVVDSVPDAESGDTFTALASSRAAPRKLLNHWTPYLLAVGLLSCYLLFFMSLYMAGQIDAAPLSVLASLVCWVGGFVWLVTNSVRALESAQANTTTELIIAFWCNLGIVAIATLLGGDMRLLLLVGVVFGILYTCLLYTSDAADE